MRHLWIWVLPLALAATTFGSLGREPLAIKLLVYAALTLAVDTAAWRTWRGVPVYRRHLAIFLVAVAAVPLSPAAAPGALLGLALSCLPLARNRWLATLGWRRGSDRRPDPAVPLVLVADPHWSGELTGLAEATAAWPGADWLFLGDIFDVWVGIPGMETPLQVEFLAWVEERRRQGRWVGFWMGNREYFLDGLAGRFDLMGEGLGGALPAEALAWEHGDLINAADWRYRVWNLISRSGITWLVARLLPRAAARALAGRLERAMRTTNRAYKLAFPRAAFAAAAAGHPGETFITGHFHTFEEVGNGTALPWAHEGNFMLWQDRRIKPATPGARLY